MAVERDRGPNAHHPFDVVTGTELPSLGTVVPGMDELERIAALEQALRDARSQRDAAQRRAAQQAEKADVWETRAHDRADRIERLVADRDQLRTLSGWVRAKAGRTLRPPAHPDPETLAPVVATPELSAPRRRAFPTIRVASLVADPILTTILDETNVASIAAVPSALDSADLVVIEADLLETMDDHLRTRFDLWLTSLARPPLVFIDGSDEELPLGPGDVAATRAWRRTGGSSIWVIPTSFDPTVWNPQQHFDQDAFIRRFDLTVSITDRVVTSVAYDASEPWMLAAAASAVAFPSAEEDPKKRGVGARRVAYRDSAPWIVAEQLLDRVGISHKPAAPTVCGILLSMRPELVARAMRGFADQRYMVKELVVGCHGFSSSQIVEVVDELGEALPIRVMEFDSDLPLGRCLNAAIDTSSARLIAKIDDDDYYGPCYIEDAVQANLYAGAPLVGKGATFTYLEGRDETILRRPELIERYYDGSPSGASLVFERQLWEKAPFPHRTLGEDLAFIEGLRLLGFRPYATSPWEFVYHRGVRGNTWDAIDEVFMERSLRAWGGHHPERAAVDA